LLGILAKLRFVVSFDMEVAAKNGMLFKRRALKGKGEKVCLPEFRTRNRLLESNLDKSLFI